MIILFRKDYFLFPFVSKIPNYYIIDNSKYEIWKHFKIGLDRSSTGKSCTWLPEIITKKKKLNREVG